MNKVTTYYKDQIKERKEKYLKNFINSEHKDIIEKAYDAAVKDVEDVTIERLRNKLVKADYQRTIEEIAGSEDRDKYIESIYDGK